MVMIFRYAIEPQPLTYVWQGIGDILAMHKGTLCDYAIASARHPKGRKAPLYRPAADVPSNTIATSLSEQYYLRLDVSRRAAREI